MATKSFQKELILNAFQTTGPRDITVHDQKNEKVKIEKVIKEVPKYGVTEEQARIINANE